MIETELAPMRPPGPMRDGLAELAADLRQGSDVVEVGSWAGESAAIWLAAPTVRSLIMVDPYDPARCGHIFKMHPRASVEAARERCVKTILARHANAFLLPLPSVEAAALLAFRSFDCVYLDGAHDSASVRADIQAWLPLVAPGGCIAGHDYRSVTLCEVRSSVCSIFGRPDRVYPDGSWLKWIDRG